MAFNAELAANLSQAFRSAVTIRLSNSQRLLFEGLLQIVFGIKNLRNVQLWTRIGVQQRNFIQSRLGELELDTRVFLVDKFLVEQIPPFPVKTKCFRLPADSELARKFSEWIQDNYIREYCTRIYMAGNFICIEYASDSDNPSQKIDLDSPEFDDVIED